MTLSILAICYETTFQLSSKFEKLKMVRCSIKTSLLRGTATVSRANFDQNGINLVKQEGKFDLPLDHHLYFK